MPLLSGRLFPNLRHLGLVNGDYADAVVEALAASPILERVESLDLSQGIMTDAGAECLLSCPGFSKIQRIDVRDNFISEEMARRLEALPCEIDTRHQALAEMDGERLGPPAHGDGYYCNIAE